MECNIYLTAQSYNEENPDINLEYSSIKREGDYLVVYDVNGYNHIINLIDVFAVTYR